MRKAASAAFFLTAKSALNAAGCFAKSEMIRKTSACEKQDVLRFAKTKEKEIM
jgi:hypothetical protein